VSRPPAPEAVLAKKPSKKKVQKDRRMPTLDELFPMSPASQAANQTSSGSCEATPLPPPKSHVPPGESRVENSVEPGKHVLRGQDDIGVESVGAEVHARDPAGALILLLDGALASTQGQVLGVRGDDEPEGNVTILSWNEEEMQEEIPALVWKRKVNKGKEKVGKSPKSP
jgi:hypothetical protein